jgi:hypothetical protein
MPQRDHGVSGAKESITERASSFSRTTAAVTVYESSSNLCGRFVQIPVGEAITLLDSGFNDKAIKVYQ